MPFGNGLSFSGKNCSVRFGVRRRRRRSTPAPNSAAALEVLERRTLLTVFGAPFEISTDSDGAFFVCTSDLDGDGDLDVLSASADDDSIAWYQNDGNGNLGLQQLISVVSDGPVSIQTADLDGDSDPDVLVASRFDDTVAWFENRGAGVFGPQRVITAEADGATSAVAADMDGDGDLDVLAASFLDDTIAWYENQGDGTFGGGHLVTSSADGVVSISTSDLDGDGDWDVVSASHLDDTVAWYENQGAGTFSAPQAISTLADGATAVGTADLDGDGDHDVLSTSYLDDTVAWYENLGSGSFAARQLLTTAADGAYALQTADLDADGDIDVLSASVLDHTVAWFENQGHGVFGTRQIISDAAPGAQHLSVADLDGDSDLDVVAALNSADAIVWYPHNATPTLQAIANRVVNENSTPVTVDLEEIGPGSSETQAVRVTAVSSDNSKVQITALDYTSPADNGSLTLTPARNALGTATITVTVEDAGFDGDWDTLADNAVVQRDFTVRLTIPRPVWHAPTGTVADQTPAFQWSDVDVLADADGAEHYELWVNNLSTGQERVLHQTHVVDHQLATTGFAEGQLLSSSADGVVSMHVVDLDGDGDLDVLAAAQDENTVAWYPNQGAGVFAERQVITGSASGVCSVFSADVDNDGDADVLLAARDEDTIAWYPNLGSGVFDSRRVINSSADGASWISAADLDGDGDWDVLSASMDHNTVDWYENRGGVFGPRQQITNQLNGVASVYATDLDNDGDTDVLAASFLGDSVIWYANRGDGVFGAARIISSTTDGAWAVRASDLDGDGDPDVIAASRDNDTVAWFPNLGRGEFGAAQAITTQLDDATSVDVADVDGDGDLDVIATGYLANLTVWFENQGQGSFGALRPISDAYTGAMVACAADLDNDGDPDIISAAVRDNTLAWHENTTARLDLGRYAAWVRAFDSAGRSGPWSEVETFRVSTAPEFSGPAAETRDPTPTLAWNSVAGATRYELWLNDIDRRRSRIIHETALSSTSFTPTTRLASGRYRAWVRAFDSENRPTPWSTARTFRVATAPQFLDDIQNTPHARPQFRWNAAVEADHYELWIRGLGRTPNPYIHETHLATTQFTPDSDLPIGTYFAWVRGVYGDGSETSWSQVDRFRVVTPPVITGPLERTTDRTPAFSWQGVVGAERYELWVSNTSTGQRRLIHETEITSTNFVPAVELPTGVYRAWVRGVDVQGAAARWSACHEFVVTVDTPTIVAPRGLVSGVPIEFEWTAVADASRYELWVRNMTTGQDRAIHDANLSSTQYTHTEPLSTGDYRMWARAFDTHGIAGDWITGDFQVAVFPVSIESNWIPATLHQRLATQTGMGQSLASGTMSLAGLPVDTDCDGRDASRFRRQTVDTGKSPNRPGLDVDGIDAEGEDATPLPLSRQLEAIWIEQILKEWTDPSVDPSGHQRPASAGTAAIAWPA